MANKIRVTVWGENVHEHEMPVVAKIYPKGMHGCIADALNTDPEITATTATLDQPEHGLTDAVLNGTDVMVWWGHMAHEEVKDEIAEKVYQRVLNGMGLIALHSANSAKPFRKLMGTTCTARWREAGEKHRLWVVAPAHPIAEGLGDYFEIPHTEMYGEYFDIPRPDDLIFISWFQGGDVFRSGCCFYRGMGKIFYFRPGHETFPTYFNPQIRKVIANAVRWAAPNGNAEPIRGNTKPLETIYSK